MIAPIAAGWILANSRLSWRWTEWVALAISGFAYLLALLLLPETYLPVLLDWKAQSSSRRHGRFSILVGARRVCIFRSAHAVGSPTLPVLFFAREPVISISRRPPDPSLRTCSSSSLSGFEYIFKVAYDLSVSQTGSCFGAIAAGSTAATLCAPGLYSWARRKTEHVHGASVEAEFRLRPAIAAPPLLPTSLFILGWGAGRGISIWLELGRLRLVRHRSHRHVREQLRVHHL